MKKIAIITTKWNTDFVTPCVETCLETFQKQWIDKNTTDVFTVPWGVEIPLLTKKLAQTEKYSAIIAVAFICENPIYRYDFVARSVVDSIIRLSIDLEIPVLSSILSPVTFDRKNQEQVDFYANHMKVKWKEIAESCVEIIEVHKKI